MTEHELLDSVVRCLEDLGLNATILETREGRKTADIRAEYNDETYIVEVKMRDRRETLNAIVSPLAVGEMVSLVPEPIYYRNSLSSAISEGVKQLTETAENSADFRLLWFHASDNEAETDKQQIEGTLTGQAHLLHRAPGGQVMLCYFFSESTFFTQRLKLDGAFVAFGDELFFLMNSYSSRYESLRRSRVVEVLGGAAWDPLGLERDGKVLIADCDTDRKDIEAVLAYVSKKYGKDYMLIELQRYGGIMRVR